MYGESYHSQATIYTETDLKFLIGKNQVPLSLYCTLDHPRDEVLPRWIEKDFDFFALNSYYSSLWIWKH